MDRKITLACRSYDIASPILQGLVKLPGFDLRARGVDDAVEIFRGMFGGEYDVSEMSLAELVYYTSRGRCDFVGIPVFPSRMFRHRFIFCHAASKIRSPRDLNGRRIGCLRWVQTAHVWVRGMLAESYGVRPAETGWYVCGLHHWDGEESEEIEPRDGSVVRMLPRNDMGEYEAICRALTAGSLDALIVTENSLYERFLGGSGNVKRLFENYRDAELAYFKETGLFPIMHVVVTRKSLIEEFPELAPNLFRLFSEAKRFARRRLHSVPRMTLAWESFYLEEEAGIFQGDPWAYGFAKNRATIEKFLSYCYEQGVSARRLEAEELFAPSTLALAE